MVAIVAAVETQTVARAFVISLRKGRTDAQAPSPTSFRVGDTTNHYLHCDDANGTVLPGVVFISCFPVADLTINVKNTYLVQPSADQASRVFVLA